MKNRLLLPVVTAAILLATAVSGQGIATRMSPRHTGSITDKSPMITSAWGQGCFFNAGCPNDTASHTTCLHVPAGPGAVAMAQIMKYYQYPAHGTGEHGYPHPLYGIQFANFGMTNYDWGSLPDTLTTGSENLALVIYQCGVAQNMNYGPVSSSSLADDIDSAFVKYFGFPRTATWKSRTDYSLTEWIEMLKAELDASHPVLYSATDSTGLIQHYIICDGYQGDSLFHFNWGFNGAFDGYYMLKNLKPDTVEFSFSQRALFNLAPPQPFTGSYVMDFENVPNFSLTFNDWTTIDEDKHETYGITGYSFLHQNEPMAFLSFNPAQVNPSMATDQAIQPHGGLRFGACFSSNPPSNSDWFISPRIQLGVNGSFSFWVKSYNDLYGLDTYTVAVSTKDNIPADFTVISGTQPMQTSTTWTNKTFDLSAYNNKKVYVAIHCVSNDHFLMMIDDLAVQTQASSTLKADFLADKTSVRIGETINFTDKSTGVPTSWAWTFTGGTPATSGLQNPEGVKYMTPGLYTVSLKVSNGQTSDSVTRVAYITVAGYATFMSLDFESLSDFTMNFNPWTLVDTKGGNTYVFQGVIFPNEGMPMSFICFNPSQTTPPLDSLNMHAHSGKKLGCSFSSMPPMNPNDKWLISPKMSLGTNPKIEFWVQTYNNYYGDEKYNVAVSVTDPVPADFIRINTIPEIAPTTWTKRSYELSNYSNQDVYIGIQCVTDASFIFMIDDISITSSLGTGEMNPLERIVVYPNPAKEYLTILCPSNSLSAVKIEMISMVGAKMASWSELPVSGKITLDVHDFPLGVYLIRVSCDAGEVSRKVSLIK